MVRRVLQKDDGDADDDDGPVQLGEGISEPQPREYVQPVVPTCNGL